MRILIVIGAAAAVIGGTVATFKVPNTAGQQQVLASYQADPKATLLSIETAILECVPGIAQSRVGMSFTRSVIAPLYVHLLHLRKEGADKAAISAQMQKWIVNEHPKVLTGLPDKEFLELVSYLKKTGEDDVENCILSAVSKPANLGGDASRWNLRL
ncbi:hypothetical protein [Rhizobium sp. BK251]|uniref:hypothetical protein n=1 Tax=Rhizobium sp. BK251 TaxID=2512125 RepID=UPI001043D59F|nr:hypothetical protein [Rhizobium sp. BK251]TCL74857.1 hypothetical protein EV286_102420 [Rhizobium sp. BK251]